MQQEIQQTSGMREITNVLYYKYLIKRHVRETKNRISVRPNSTDCMIALKRSTQNGVRPYVQPRDNFCFDSRKKKLYYQYVK